MDEFIVGVRRERFGFKLGCNARMGDMDFSGMRSAGFRMLLFGLESANQRTLDRINKGVHVEDIQYVKKAAKAGLDCHGTFMFGYPWETETEALNTLSLAHELLRKGILKTAQASFYSPNTQMGGNENHRKYVKKLYDVKWNPEFLFNQLKDVRDWNDVKYLWKKVLASIQK